MAGAHPLGSDGAELRERSDPRGMPGSGSPRPAIAPVGPPGLQEATAAASVPPDQDHSESARVWQPRLLVALVLIVAGVAWIVARGLNFYGASVMDIIYDLDQPPLLLVLVGGWLAFRSRRA